MEQIRDQLKNFGKAYLLVICVFATDEHLDYWNATDPAQYDITAYDLSFCKAQMIQKQACHKFLSSDIDILLKTFPDDNERKTSLVKLEKRIK
ncbi:hypothetical protein MBANPS3_010300, partial [Mucor bainieri]